MRDQDGSAEDRAGNDPALGTSRCSDVVEAGADTAENTEHGEDEVGDFRDTEEVPGQGPVESRKDDGELSGRSGGAHGAAAAVSRCGDPMRSPSHPPPRSGIGERQAEIAGQAARGTTRGRSANPEGMGRYSWRSHRPWWHAAYRGHPLLAVGPPGSASRHRGDRARGGGRLTERGGSGSPWRLARRVADDDTERSISRGAARSLLPQPGGFEPQRPVGPSARCQASRMGSR